MLCRGTLRCSRPWSSKNVSTFRVSQTRCISTDDNTEALVKELKSRKLPVRTDFGNPTNWELAKATFDYMSDSRLIKNSQRYLWPGRHLLHFPPIAGTNDLLEDGTDLLHAPDRSYKYRLWTGGSTTLYSPVHFRHFNRLQLVEKIANVKVRGGKIFVQIHRVVVDGSKIGHDHRHIDLFPIVGKAYLGRIVRVNENQARIKLYGVRGHVICHATLSHSLSAQAKSKRHEVKVKVDALGRNSVTGTIASFRPKALGDIQETNDEKFEGLVEKVFGPSGLLQQAQENLRAARSTPLDSASIALEETRWLCFMKDKPPSSAPVAIRPPPSDQEIYYQTSLTTTPAMLFRFSALTFNAHAIHIDPEYTKSVYGLPDLLVHGPLTFFLLINNAFDMADKFSESDTDLANKNTYLGFDSLDYRNLEPIYVGEPLTICCTKPKPMKETHPSYREGLFVATMWIAKQTSAGTTQVCVTANVTLHSRPHRFPRPSEQA